MIQYTKEYIQELLTKYMDGTSTLDEEDILSSYFKGDNIPEEWTCYQQLFQEIETMQPSDDQPVIEQPAAEQSAVEQKPESRRRWMVWSLAAAAVVAGVVYLAVPAHQSAFVPAAPLTAQTDTTTVQSETEMVQPQTEMVQPQTETVHTDTLLAPKAAVQPAPAKKRSKRKIVPTIHDIDKAYALMAQVEAQVQAEDEMIEAKMAAYGYIPVMQEDGTIVYINEQTNFIAYEE